MMTQDDTPAFASVSASLLVSLLNGAAGYAAGAAELLAGTSVTVDRWRVLEAVAHHRELTMSGLAAELGAPSSTTTRLVDHLVSDGALHRVVDQVDRRRVLLRVTDHGRATLTEVRRHLEPLETALEAAFGQRLDGAAGYDGGGDEERLLAHVVAEERTGLASRT